MESGKKIKVLIVAPGSPMVGGQTIQASRLLEKLDLEDELRVDFQPINPSFFPTFQKLKFIRTVLTSFRYVFDLLVKVPRYDIIHIFSASYFSFVLAPTPAILISKFFRKKTILHYHSGEAEDHLKTWHRTAVPTINLVDKVIVPSGYLVDVFDGFGIRADPVSNFIDTDTFTFRARENCEPTFLSNRNFDGLYNVSCTLRAFKLIQEQIPDAKLFVAGDGRERERLHKLAKELKLNDVKFLGRVSPEDMPMLYDRVDIYLNSPNIDNMPNSIIEAFVSGVPVVSTNAGGIPYIVENGKTGLLVDTDDHIELANSALKLLADGGLAKRIILKAKAETENYTWNKVRKMWIEIYTDLAQH